MLICENSLHAKSAKKAKPCYISLNVKIRKKSVLLINSHGANSTLVLSLRFRISSICPFRRETICLLPLLLSALFASMTKIKPSFFRKLRFCQESLLASDVWWNCRFVELSFCRIVVWSNCRFVELLLHQVVNLYDCHFFKLLFCQIVQFCRIRVIFSNSYCIELLFCKIVERSIVLFGWLAVCLKSHFVEQPSQVVFSPFVKLF